MSENDKIVVEIPVYYLLQLSVHGNMGTGELPDMIKSWSQRILKEKGYLDLFRKQQQEHIQKLREGLINVMGKDNMQKVDNALSDAITGLKFATELNKGNLQ